MRFLRKTLVLIIFSFTVSISIFSSSTFADNDIEIPKLFLTGDISDMSDKSDKRKVLFHYENDNNNIDGYAKIKLQGSASLNFEKKNYTIDLYEDDNYKNKNNVHFGWGEHDKYTLKANWIDKTHSRNIVTANLAAELNEKYGLFSSTPNHGEIDGYPIEVYVNNDFFGLYTLNIAKSDWMFGMDKSNVHNILFSSEQWENQNLFKSKIEFDGTWDLEIGDDEGYAIKQLNKAVDFVMNSADVDFRQNINSYFNLDNLLNYYALSEFAELVDNVGKNVLMASYDGDKWLFALYDLDLSWGVWFDQSLNYEVSSGIEKNLLFQRLRENFPNELADRYFTLRKTMLTEENIMNKFYEFESKIPQSTLEKDQAKWGESVGYDISQIRDFLKVRVPKTDSFFYNMYTVEPQVYLKYENSKNNDSVKITLIKNREDITATSAGNASSEFTFYQNGIYEISCHDWFGNYLESFKIEVDSIEENETDFEKIIPMIIFGSLASVLVAFILIRRLIRFKTSSP